MTASLETRLRTTIREVPDFPKPGILFKDITPVLADAALFSETTRAMARPFQQRGVTHVIAIESRGFILGAPVAQHLGAGLVPVRKRGKLPWKTLTEEYALEYGTDVLEIHADALPAGAIVIVVDDVLATGGTAQAVGTLVRRAGAVLHGFSFLMALGFLGGRARLGTTRVETILEY
ncbi:MAG TPA: adenine phosphoribosyltransferase [Gemmatimonadaceae bacterium]|nr:adenine phosphoribosyltransferase [Gemmatimonadaceae bacterium]